MEVYYLFFFKRLLESLLIDKKEEEVKVSMVDCRNILKGQSQSQSLNKLLFYILIYFDNITIVKVIVSKQMVEKLHYITYDIKYFTIGMNVIVVLYNAKNFIN